MEISESVIESFVVNNKDLNEIESYINRFNPIKIMKMETMEIRHSSILGWLLNPRENHGLGDEFLRCFISEALKNSVNQPVKALDIYSAQLHDSNVYVEWNNIDIFIETRIDKDEELAILIENKVYSSQSDNQLKKYSEFIKKRFDKHKIIGIFLTLLDEEPEEVGEVEFSSIQYSNVVSILDNLINQFQDSLSIKVLNFIKYYKEVVSELCQMSNKEKEMQILAKKVYRDNKAVIDYIIENGSSTEFVYAVNQIVTNAPNGENPDKNTVFKVSNHEFRFFAHTNKIVSLLPEKWVKILGDLSKMDIAKDRKYPWKGCEKWWHSYPLICWIQLEEKKSDFQLKLICEVGPLAYDLRTELIKLIESTGKEKKSISFSSSANNPNAKYSRFLKGKNFQKTLNDAQDSEKIMEAIKQILGEFGNKIIDPISIQLDRFMKNNISLIEYDSND